MRGVGLLTLVLLASQVVFSQTKSVEEKIKKKVERLDSKVELTAEQKEKISAIIMESNDQIRTVRKESPLDTAKIRVIKKESRQLVKKELTKDQQMILKEKQKSNREGRKVHHQKRKEHKALILEKRMSFNRELSPDELQIIEDARALAPAKLSKQERESLTEEEKAERKAVKKKIKKMLNPVIENHQSELAAILESLPVKEEHKDKKKKSKTVRFLLMK